MRHGGGVKKSLLGNFGVNVASAMLPIAIQLVTVPLYLHLIGQARYGLLSIVWLLLGYFGFLDLGLSRAAANALARLPIHATTERARVLATTCLLNLGLGCVGGVILYFGGTLILTRLLKLPVELVPEVDALSGWIAGLLPLAFLSGVGVGALEARERFVVANIVQVGGQALGQLLPLAAVYALGPSLAVVVPIAALVRGATALVTLLLAARQEHVFTHLAFDRAKARALLGYGGWVSLSGLLSPLIWSVDQVMIGAIQGVARVAAFAVPMNLVQRTQVIGAALARTLFPRLSSASEAEAEAAQRSAILALGHCFGMVCFGGILLLRPFLELWVGRGMADQAAPIGEILFFGIWINSVASVSLTYLLARGMPRLLVKLQLIELLPCVAMFWAMTHFFGVVGAAVAFSIRCLLDAALIMAAARIRLRDAWQLAGPALVLLAGAMVSLGVMPGLIARIAIGAAIGAVWLWLCWWKLPELREPVMQRLRRPPHHVDGVM